MNWYITTNGYAKAHQKNAGSKAPSDIGELCGRLGMKPLFFQPFPRDASSVLYMKIWLLTMGAVPWLNVFRKAGKGDVILYQHPLYGNRLVNRVIPLIRAHKQCKFIALIHDLESLRKGIGAHYTRAKAMTNEIADHQLLRQFDVVICHNPVMREYLISQGFDGERVLSLGVFDYLTPCSPSRPGLSKTPSIAIAGNLSPKKSRYIYQLDYPKEVLEVHLYGVEFQQDMASGNLNYHGSFEPEELPNQLQGDFGLVWDGSSAETCAGNTGEYLRYNNPHKVSLYLASNMPVIIWKEAALASYICDHKLGIAVRSLGEIPERLRSLTPADYQEMCTAVRAEGERIRSGQHTIQALEKAFRLLEDGQSHKR